MIPGSLSPTRNAIESRESLTEVDKLLDRGEGDAEVLKHCASFLKDLNDITSNEALDLSQKDKVRWSIEGDETTSTFTGFSTVKDPNLPFARFFMTVIGL
ncbi:hypothetical protein Tco_1434002 [Tanacetum coccineum]